MKAHFPTSRELLSASVFDVAGVMLELFSEQPASRFSASPSLISHWADQYTDPLESDLRNEVGRALSEAWSWLQSNGLVAYDLMCIGVPGAFVTRAGRQVKSRADFLAYAKAALLPRDILRPELDIVIPLFLGGHFDAAVSTAFIQLEAFVRQACGYPDDLSGVRLMRAAFDRDRGPLTLKEAAPDEREAALNLFAGAIAYYKDEFGHRIVGVSNATHAASIILFANELLSRVAIHKRSAEQT